MLFVYGSCVRYIQLYVKGIHSHKFYLDNRAGVNRNIRLFSCFTVCVRVIHSGYSHCKNGILTFFSKVRFRFLYNIQVWLTVNYVRTVFSESAFWWSDFESSLSFIAFIDWYCWACDSCKVIVSEIFNKFKHSYRNPGAPNRSCVRTLSLNNKCTGEHFCFSEDLCFESWSAACVQPINGVLWIADVYQVIRAGFIIECVIKMYELILM